jgi:hypothetical protein
VRADILIKRYSRKRRRHSTLPSAGSGPGPSFLLTSPTTCINLSYSTVPPPTVVSCPGGCAAVCSPAPTTSDRLYGRVALGRSEPDCDCEDDPAGGHAVGPTRAWFHYRESRVEGLCLLLLLLPLSLPSSPFDGKSANRPRLSLDMSSWAVDHPSGRRMISPRSGGTQKPCKIPLRSPASST